MPQSLAQRRAKDALDKVQTLRDENFYGNFDSYVKSLPATIIMNGLGQAMAGLLASAKLSKENRSEDNFAYKKLYDTISTWLCRNETDAPYQSNDSDLMENIINGDEATYLKAQAETMAYLEWLKKFSNAYLGK